jgi:hypothetical protein
MLQLEICKFLAGDFLSTYFRCMFLLLIDVFFLFYETLLIRQKCKQYILKWDAVGSKLKQTKRKHQLTIKTCIKYVDKKSPAKNLQNPSRSIATLLHVCIYKLVYQFHPGT